jgi:hypothetical protein
MARVGAAVTIKLGGSREIIPTNRTATGLFRGLHDFISFAFGFTNQLNSS